MTVHMYGQPASWAFLPQRQLHAAPMQHHQGAFGGGGGQFPGAGSAYPAAAFMAATNGGGGAHFVNGHGQFRLML